jgi:hypothetical protein
MQIARAHIARLFGRHDYVAIISRSKTHSNEPFGFHPKPGNLQGGTRNGRAAATSVPVEPEPEPKPNEWHEIMHS